MGGDASLDAIETVLPNRRTDAGNGSRIMSMCFVGGAHSLRNRYFVSDGGSDGPIRAASFVGDIDATAGVASCSVLV